MKSKDMDKKDMETISREVKKQCRYLSNLTLRGMLWEFLKRNNDYFDTYYLNAMSEPFYKKFDENGWPRKAKHLDYRKKIKSFGLKKALDPLRPFKDEAEKEAKLKSVFMLEDPVEFMCWDDDDDNERYWNLRTHAKPYSKFILRIDGEASYKKISSLVESELKKIKAFLKENPPEDVDEKKPASRARNEWIEYIIAYDLKYEKKLRLKDIAKILYPKEPNEYPDLTVNKKISRHLKEIKKLINGRYKDYLS